MFNMFSPSHVLFFGILALLFFGNRLPEVGRSLGRGIMEFKKGLSEVSNEINRADEPRPKRKLRPPPDDEYDDEDDDYDYAERPQKPPRKQTADRDEDDGD